MDHCDSYSSKLAFFQSLSFPTLNLEAKKIHVLGKSISQCHSFLQSTFKYSKKAKYLKLVEKFYNCTFNLIEFKDASSLHSIQDYYNCSVILAWPDEHTPFSTLIDYLNALRHGTVEILWVVIDRINGPIWDIFQGRTALNLKFINSNVFEKDFERQFERAHSWAWNFDNKEETCFLLPIQKDLFLLYGTYFAQVSLIDGVSGNCREVLFAGRTTKFADQKAGCCQLAGMGWDATKQHVLIFVKFLPPDDDANVGVHNMRNALLVIDLKRRELTKCYIGATRELVQWIPSPLSLVGNVLLPWHLGSVVEDGLLYCVQARCEPSVLLADDADMSLRLAPDHFQPLANPSPSTFAVYEIATGKLLYRQQSVSGDLVAMDIHKNLMALVVNTAAHTYQVELRMPRELETVITRLGTDVFRSRIDYARDVFMGNKFLVVSKRSLDESSLSIVTLKDLKLFAKIRLHARFQMLNSWMHPETPERLVLHVCSVDGKGTSFLVCINIEGKNISWLQSAFSASFKFSAKKKLAFTYYQ